VRATNFPQGLEDIKKNLKLEIPNWCFTIIKAWPNLGGISYDSKPNGDANHMALAK
jgi:hypothetical protein